MSGDKNGQHATREHKRPKKARIGAGVSAKDIRRLVAKLKEEDTKE